MNPPPSTLRSMQIFEALSLLRPSDTTSMQKLRVGNEGDGGYVMFDDFSNISAVYSFGIGSQIAFDHQIAEMGKKVHMFDHTITGLPFEHLNFDWMPHGLGPQDDDGAKLFTLAYQMDRLGHSNTNDLALKIDVEGAEFEAVGNTSVHVLRQFRQFVLEIHWLSHLSQPAYLQRFTTMLQRINSVFTLCHVHGNNCAPVVIVDGHPVADVLELTYIRSDLIKAEPSKTVFPTKLDYANAHWESDILLWFFPFLPTMMNGAADPLQCQFQSSLAHADQILRRKQISELKEVLTKLETETLAVRSQLGELLGQEQSA